MLKELADCAHGMSDEGVGLHFLKNFIDALQGGATRTK